MWGVKGFQLKDLFQVIKIFQKSTLAFKYLFRDKGSAQFHQGY